MSALRRVKCMLVLASLAACQDEPEPLALPYQTVVELGEPTVDLWVFDADAAEPALVSTSGTGLRRAEWLAERPGVTPVGARELRVTMARPEGSFSVNGSNALEFVGREARPRIRGPGRAVAWRPGSRTVLIAKSWPTSVRLVTPGGDALPANAFDCRLEDDGPLREQVTFCTVSASGPLSGGGALRSVRARIEDLGDVELTNEVVVP